MNCWTAAPSDSGPAGTDDWLTWLPIHVVAVSGVLALTLAVTTCAGNIESDSMVAAAGRVCFMMVASTRG